MPARFFLENLTFLRELFLKKKEGITPLLLCGM
jgi:hypothetical protein